MKKIKVNSIDLKKMSNIKGGEKGVTINKDIMITKQKNQIMTSEDHTTEIVISSCVEV